MPYPNLTECEAGQFERDFWDNIGCAPEEYVRIRRAIRLLELRYPDSLNELVCAAIATPLGEMLAVFGVKGLCLLEFVGQKYLEQEIAAVQKPCADGLCFGKTGGCNFASGIGFVFPMPSENLCHALGNDWYGVSKQAWDVLAIPYGETRSYKEQAQRLGNPKPSAPLPPPTGRTRCLS